MRRTPSTFMEQFSQDGRVYHRVEFEWQGDGRTDSEVVIAVDECGHVRDQRLPSVGTVVYHLAEITEGTATQFCPAFGTRQGFVDGSPDDLTRGIWGRGARVGTGPAQVRSSEFVPYAVGREGKLVYIPRPSSGADNRIRTVMLIVEGVLEGPTAEQPSVPHFESVTVPAAFAGSAVFTVPAGVCDVSLTLGAGQSDKELAVRPFAVGGVATGLSVEDAGLQSWRMSQDPKKRLGAKVGYDCQNDSGGPLNALLTWWP